MFAERREMIDNFALGLTHALMMIAAWRLLSRPDVDDDDASPADDPKKRLWSNLRSGKSA